jgi:hypothetical protein
MTALAPGIDSRVAQVAAWSAAPDQLFADAKPEDQATVSLVVEQLRRRRSGEYALIRRGVYKAPRLRKSERPGRFNPNCGRGMTATEKLHDFFQGRPGEGGIWLGCPDRTVWEITREHATEVGLLQRHATKLAVVVASALAVRAGAGVPAPWDVESCGVR